jgi:hypothetical protein
MQDNVNLLSVNNSVNTQSFIDSLQPKLPQPKSENTFSNLVSIKDMAMKSFSEQGRFKAYNVPVSEQYDTIFGKLKPKYNTYVQGVDNNEYWAQRQSWGDKIVNGLTKNSLKAASYVADGTIGFVAGVANAIKEGEVTAFAHNDFSKYIDEIGKSLDNALPSRVTAEEEKMNFFNKALTINFWANDVAGAMAFTAGAIGSEAVWAGLTGGSSLALSGAKWGARAGKFLTKGGKLAPGFLKQGVKKGLNSYTNTIARGGAFGAASVNALNNVRFMATSSGFEASVEARSAIDEYIIGFENYIQQKEGRTPTFEEYQSVADDIADASNGVFYTNMAILSVSNILQFGNITGLTNTKFFNRLAKPFNKASEFVTGKRIVAGEGGELIAKKGNKFQRTLTKTYDWVKNPITEAMEEGSQGWAKGYQEMVLKSKYDEESLYQNLSSIAMVKESLNEYLEKDEAWHEMGIGFIVGKLGGVFRGGIVKGLGAELRYGAEYNQDVKTLGEQAEAINKQRMKMVDSSKEALERVLRFNQQQSFNKAANDAMKEGDAATAMRGFRASSFMNLDAHNAAGMIDESLENFQTSLQLMDNTTLANELGIDTSEVEKAKTTLLDQYKKDVKAYKAANKFASVFAPQLNKKSLKKQHYEQELAFTHFMGKDSLDNAESLAQQIEQAVGKEGFASHLRMFDNLEDNAKKAAIKLNRAVKKEKELEDEYASLQTEYSTLLEQQKRVEENTGLVKRIETNRKKAEKTLETKNAATKEKKELEEQLKTMPLYKEFQFSNELEKDNVTTSQLSNTIEELEKLGSFLEQLRKDNPQQAELLEILLGEYKGSVQDAILHKNTLEKLTDSNFNYTNYKGVQKLFTSPKKYSKPEGELTKEQQLIEDFIETNEFDEYEAFQYRLLKTLEDNMNSAITDENFGKYWSPNESISQDEYSEFIKEHQVERIDKKDDVRISESLKNKLLNILENEQDLGYRGNKIYEEYKDLFDEELAKRKKQKGDSLRKAKKAANKITPLEGKSQIETIRQLIQDILDKKQSYLKDRSVGKTDDFKRDDIPTEEEFKRYNTLKKRSENKPLSPKLQEEFNTLQEKIAKSGSIEGTGMSGFSLDELYAQLFELEELQKKDDSENRPEGAEQHDTQLDEEISKTTETKAAYDVLQTYDKATVSRTKDSVLLHNVSLKGLVELLAKTLETGVIKIAKKEISEFPNTDDIIGKEVEISYTKEDGSEGKINLKVGERGRLIFSNETAEKIEEETVIRFGISHNGKPMTAYSVAFMDIEGEQHPMPSILDGENTTPNTSAIQETEVGEEVEAFVNLEDEYNADLIKKLKAKKITFGQFTQKLKIEYRRGDGVTLGVIKADYNSGSNNPAYKKMQQVREEVAKKVFSQLGASEIQTGVKDTVKHVYIGHPAITVKGGKVVLHEVRSEHADKIEDVGYVQDGKVVLRNGVEGVSKSFINRIIKDKNGTYRGQRVPIVVLNFAGKKIAYPVTQKHTTNPNAVDDLLSIYNSDKPLKDKVLEIYNLLAENNIDPNTVDLRTDNISETKIQEIVEQLRDNKIYAAIQELTESKTKASEIAIEHFMLNIDLSGNMFYAPKVVLDYVKEEKQNKKQEELSEEDLEGNYDIEETDETPIQEEDSNEEDVVEEQPTITIPKLSTVKIDLESLSIEELENVAKQLRQKAVNARQAEKDGKTVLGGSAFIESDYQAVKKYVAELKALEQPTSTTQSDIDAKADVDGVSIEDDKPTFNKDNLPEGTSDFGVVEVIMYNNKKDNAFRPDQQLTFRQGGDYGAVTIVGDPSLIELISLGSRKNYGKRGDGRVEKLEKELGITAIKANRLARELARAERGHGDIIIVLGKTGNTIQESPKKSDKYDIELEALEETTTQPTDTKDETEEVKELSKEEAVKEVQSKNLTHVRGLGMSAQQASGTYISTEEQNRYATEENRAERVFVNITSPLVVSNDTGFVSKRNEILNQQKSKFSAEDSFTYEELENKELTVDDLNEQGLEKLAILVTESLIEEGYDSIYFPETSTQEGELVVFHRENVQFEDDYNQEEAELLEGGAKKRREVGYFDLAGVRYERQSEDSDSPKGNKGNVKFADKLSVPYTYELRESKKVQPSHKNRALNNLHFIPEAQPKDRRTKDSVIQIKQIADNPNLLEAGESPIAYSGAPVINKRGEVIQGNNRAQGIIKHYEEQGSKYKQQLIENAEKFGFTKEQVEAMENPVLVRVVNATDADAIKLGNYDSADIESAGSGRLDIDKLDKRVTTEDKSRLLDAVFKDSDTETINSSIRANIDKIYQILEPYLNLSQKNSLFGKTSIPQEAINDLERLFQKFLFINTSTLFDTAFQNLPINVQKGIHKAAALLLKVPKNKSIIKDLQNAIIANYNFSKSGVENSIEWLNQGSLFGEKSPIERYTPLEIEIFKIIQSASKIEDTAKPLMDYARATATTPRTLFEEEKEGLSREEAVKKVFNVEYIKNSTPIVEEVENNKNNVTKKQTTNSPEVKIESNGENTKNTKIKSEQEEGREKPIFTEFGANLTPKFSDAVSNRDKEKLTPHQVKGVNAIINAVNKGFKGFLLADGAGAGKTRQLLVAAKELSNQGKRVLIVTENKEIISGSFRKDSADLGLNFSQDANGEATVEGVEITTVTRYQKDVVNENYDVVIFDESQKASGFSGTGNKLKAFRGQVIFSSATPFDTVDKTLYIIPRLLNISQEEYLTRIGAKLSKRSDGKLEVVFNNRDKTKFYNLLNSLHNTLISQGKMLHRRYEFFGVDDLNFEVTGEDFVNGSYDINTAEDGINNHYSQLARKARLTSDDIKKGLTIEDKRRKINESKVNELKRLAETYKATQELVDEVKEKIAKGEQVVLYGTNITETITFHYNGVEDAEFDDGSESEKYKRPSFISQMKELLAKEGIEFIEVIGTNKKRAKDVERFQNGQVKVALVNQAGTTGINLNDTVGNAPRTLYIAGSLPNAIQLEQLKGRVSRLNNASKAKVVYITANSNAESRDASKRNEKLAILNAVLEGQQVEYTNDNKQVVDVSETPTTINFTEEAIPDSFSIVNISDRAFAVKFTKGNDEQYNFLMSIGGKYIGKSRVMFPKSRRQKVLDAIGEKFSENIENSSTDGAVYKLEKPLTLYKGTRGKLNPDGTKRTAHPDVKGRWFAADVEIAKNYSEKDSPLLESEIPIDTEIEVVRIIEKNKESVMSEIRRIETDRINNSKYGIVKLITRDASGKVEEQYIDRRYILEQENLRNNENSLDSEKNALPLQNNMVTTSELRDVESTAKALEGVDKNAWGSDKGLTENFYTTDVDGYAIKKPITNPSSITIDGVDFHIAKVDGDWKVVEKKSGLEISTGKTSNTKSAAIEDATMRLAQNGGAENLPTLIDRAIQGFKDRNAKAVESLLSKEQTPNLGSAKISLPSNIKTEAKKEQDKKCD